MRKIILIIGFIFFLIVLTLIIMIIGIRQNITILSYLGAAIPFWIYYLTLYFRLLNRITVENEFVLVKNLIFGEKKVQYENIEYWEENPSIRVLYRTLLLKLKKDKKKIVISEDVDSKSYEILRCILISDWKTKERNRMY